MIPLVVIFIAMLMLLGAPVFAVLLGFSAYGATHTSRVNFFEDFGAQVNDLIELASGELTAATLSTLPLFILVGFMMAESRTADRMVRAAKAALGWLPGGLGVVTLFACAIFTTFTGASGVTVVALGPLLMPALLKEGYPKRFSLGIVAGTGSIGLLFPPALPLFVYGTIYGLTAQTMTAAEHATGEMQLIEFSTDRFILAGIIPGFVLIGVLSMYVMAVAIKRGVPRNQFDAAELGRSVVVALPEILIPVIIIGGLAKGISIPEIAAIVTVYTFVIEAFVYRDLPLRKLWRIVGEAMSLVGAIFIIMLAARALTTFFTTADVPHTVVNWITDHFESKWTFLLALNVLLLLVGTMLHIFEAIVVVVPLIVPAAAHFGIDPFHLGVVFLLNLEIGYLMPPVGLNLIISSFVFRKPVMEVVRATLPFGACMLVALLLVTYIEPLTVVPPPERRGRVVELADRVRQRTQQLSAVSEVKLPDGTVKRKSECDKLSGLDKEACVGLFIDVTRCRTKRDKACEDKAIADYLEALPGADDSEDWGTDDDDDGDAGPAEDEPDAGAADDGDEQDDGDAGAAEAAVAPVEGGRSTVARAGDD